MRLIVALSALLTFPCASAQEAGKFPVAVSKSYADDACANCDVLLCIIEGAKVTGLSAKDGKYCILIVAKDWAARRDASKLMGSDRTFEGVGLHWTVGGKRAAPRAPRFQPAPSPKRAKPPPPSASRSVAAAAPRNFWNAALTDCDILADYLGKKRTAKIKKNAWGRKPMPCQVRVRSQVGAGGGHTYQYTKHRADCPVRLGRVGPPGWSDAFMAWVFGSGITAPVRASFLHPTELRASDSLWYKQARGDARTRIPYLPQRPITPHVAKAPPAERPPIATGKKK